MHLFSFGGLFLSLLDFPEGLLLLFCQNILYREPSEVIQSLASTLPPPPPVFLVRQLSFNWVFELGSFLLSFLPKPSQAVRDC